METLARKFAEQTPRLLCWNQRAQRQVPALPQTVPWVVWESACLWHPPEIISLYFLSSISKIFGGSKLNLRSKAIKSLFLTNKGDVFSLKAKLYCSPLNDIRARGKSTGQTFPGLQLSTGGSEVEQRDMRCAKAIMADGQLCYFLNVTWVWFV